MQLGQLVDAHRARFSMGRLSGRDFANRRPELFLLDGELGANDGQIVLQCFLSSSGVFDLFFALNQLIASRHVFIGIRFRGDHTHAFDPVSIRVMINNESGFRFLLERRHHMGAGASQVGRYTAMLMHSAVVLMQVYVTSGEAGNMIILSGSVAGIVGFVAPSATVYESSLGFRPRTSCESNKTGCCSIPSPSGISTDLHLHWSNQCPLPNRIIELDHRPHPRMP